MMYVRQRFRDRREAGVELASQLSHYASDPEVVVLALPRGGVPVAYEIARSLRAPLDVFEVRKLGVPGHEELAMGAIGSGGGFYLNDEVIEALRIGRTELEETIARERTELERRAKVYRDSRPRPEIRGKTIVLVDDGVATGASAIAAIRSLRAAGVGRIVLAIPVGPIETCEILRGLVDELVCLQIPEHFHAVGYAYAQFGQVGDEEVRALLNDAAERIE